VAIVDGCTEFDTLPKPRGRSVKLDTLRTYAMPHQQYGECLADAAQCPVSIGRMRQRGDTIWANFSKGRYIMVLHVAGCTVRQVLTRGARSSCLGVVPE